MGMKQILVMMGVVVLVGCGEKNDPNTGVVNPEKLITDPIVEEDIRFRIKKPEGELTEADLKKVTYLDLNDTKVTDAGLKEMAKLQKLTSLDLWGTEITVGGLMELSRCEQLRMLFLAGIKINDTDLKEVAKLKQLSFLNLEYTKVTKAGVAQLQKALPKCEIYSNAKE